MSKPITQRCEWNRYCFFVGQFYLERLLEIGRGRPQLVGRCSGCGGYVCNRCASRRPVEGLPAGRSSGAWELLCPLDGEPLGRGDDWIIFSGTSAVVNQTVGRPGFSALYEALAGAPVAGAEQSEFLKSRAPLVAALQLLEGGRYAEVAEAYESARELTPDHAVMWLVRRRALEELGETTAAWNALRNLLYLPDEKLAEGIAELGWLKAESGVSLDSYARELFALSESRDRELRENLSLLFQNSNSSSQAAATETTFLDGKRRAQTIGGDDFPSLSAYLAEMAPTEQLQLRPATPGANRRARSLLDERYGYVIAESIPASAQTTLIVLCHEYGVPSQQQNLYRQLEHILQRDPSALILLEGFSGPRAKPTKAMKDYEKRLAVAVEMLEEEGNLAAEVLTSLYPASANIKGVDDTSLLVSQESQAELWANSRKPEPGALLSSIVDLTFEEFVLDDLERASYGPQIRTFHQLRAQFRKDGKLSAYIRGLQGMIKTAGISLKDYRSTSTLMETMEMEANLDFQKVEEERLALVKILADQSTVPVTEKKVAALDRWMKEASPDEEALTPLYPDLLKVEERKPQKKSRWWWPFKAGSVSEPEEQPDDLVWFRRLLLLSIAFRDKVIPTGYYYRRLDGLLDCLELDIPPQSLLRQYMKYMMLASLIDVSSIVTFELPALESAFRAGLCRSAQDSGATQLHREFYDLQRLLRLKLPAERACSLQGEKLSCERWASDALRLNAFLNVDEQSKSFVRSQARSSIARNSTRFDNTLTKSLEYYVYALSRSEKLVNNALEEGLDHAPIKVLVCGRFHLYQVLYATRQAPRVSLIVVAPFPKEVQKGKETKQHGWRNFEEEDGMLPVRHLS